MDAYIRCLGFLHAIRFCPSRIWNCEVQKQSKYSFEKLYGCMHWRYDLLAYRFWFRIWSRERRIHWNQILRRSWLWERLKIWWMVLSICLCMHCSNHCFRLTCWKSQYWKLLTILCLHDRFHLSSCLLLDLGRWLAKRIWLRWLRRIRCCPSYRWCSRLYGRMDHGTENWSLRLIWRRTEKNWRICFVKYRSKGLWKDCFKVSFWRMGCFKSSSICQVVPAKTWWVCLCITQSLTSRFRNIDPLARMVTFQWWFKSQNCWSRWSISFNSYDEHYHRSFSCWIGNICNWTKTRRKSKY